MSNHTLVLGTAFERGIKDVWIFVESLRRYYQGEAMLLISSRTAGLAEYLSSRGITPIFFDAPYWMRIHIQVGRYVRYGEILRGSPHLYDRVLLTDVTDVAFQADPFANLPPGEFLCFLEHEGTTIGKDKWNSIWIAQVFGPQALERVRDKPISCSGTTIGTHQAILEYIDLLLIHANPEILSRHPEYRGHDQGIHNYLLHAGALPRATLVPNGQHVYTLDTVPREQIILAPGGHILTPGGQTPAIVHQYVRRGALRQHVQSAWPIGA